MKRAFVSIHVAIFLWGFTGVLGRLISLNEGLLVWWRMFLTVASLWGYALVMRKIPKIGRKDFVRISSIGVLLALHWVCFYGSIKASNVSITLTCMASSGLLAALLEPVFFAQRLQWRNLLLGLCTLAGIGCVYFGNVNFSVGIVIGLLAALLTVLASIFNKKIVTRYDGWTITLYQFTGGFIGLSMLMPFYLHIFPSQTLLPTWSDLLWLLFLSWVCTIYPFFLYMSALKELSPFTINLSLTLEPVYGILLAFLIFQENRHLGPLFYVGFFFILFAVILHAWWHMRRAAKTF